MKTIKLIMLFLMITGYAHSQTVSYYDTKFRIGNKVVVWEGVFEIKGTVIKVEKIRIGKYNTNIYYVQPNSVSCYIKGVKIPSKMSRGRWFTEERLQ
jgi:hypothetical protein